eukprot:116114-Hanusia_phi.AAC.1
MEIRCPHTEHLSTHAEASDTGGVHHRHQRNHRPRRMEEKHGNTGRRRQTRRDHNKSHASELQAAILSLPYAAQARSRVNQRPQHAGEIS